MPRPTDLTDATFPPEASPTGWGWKAAWGAVVLALLAPLVAMQVTDEVAWTLSDFVIAGVLLAGSLGVLQLASRTTSSVAYRVGVGLALLAAVLLGWINGAVGILGDEGNPANWMYAGVVAVAAVGAFAARFRPRGMALAMVAAGAAQGLVFAIAWGVGWGFTGPITLVFLALWLGAARLFHIAAAG